MKTNNFITKVVEINEKVVQEVRKQEREQESNLTIYDRNGQARRVRGGNDTYNQTPIERDFEEIEKIIDNKDIKKLLIKVIKDIYNKVTKVLKMKGRNLKIMI